MAEQSAYEKINQCLHACRKAFIHVFMFSLLINLLMLTVPLYMLQIFDRVLASQSYDTLIYLTIIAIIALLVMSMLDVVRGRILVQISRWLDNKLSIIVLSRSVDSVLLGNNYALQGLRDISAIRNFLSGSPILSFFDMPWVPIYLAVVFILHPLLGFVALAGTVILFTLAVINQVVSRKPLDNANKQQVDNQRYIESALTNSETLHAMGMEKSIFRKWFKGNEQVLDEQGKASYGSGMVTSISKFMRMTLQLLILGLGAYLVIVGVISPGAMIAASIITARALAPVEQSIGAWKMFISAKTSYASLGDFLQQPEREYTSVELPQAKGLLTCQNLIYRPPGKDKPILRDINFQVKPGEFLGVVGASGAGKSTLARLILGIWKPLNGHVRLDGADVYTWDRGDFGRQVGYLPQGTHLFPISIKENIARNEDDATDEDIIAAAQLANIHEIILKLDKGYDTIADNYQLSGGQAQRVALARAFYGDPCLIVLDEPEANLDGDGELSLKKALIYLCKEKKTTIVMITQEPQLAKLTDKLIVLAGGAIKSYGATEDIFKHLTSSANLKE